MNTSENRTYPYMELMRNFTKAQEDKNKCKMHITTKKLFRPPIQMLTGSEYDGQWDYFGMSGRGRYTFPNGVIYEGEFEDGLFHGKGDLIYPDGTTVIGRFRYGRVVEHLVQFENGMFYNEQGWTYCEKPDRRFAIELTEGVQPAGDSYMTADQPTKKLPEGFYDSGDGLYDAETKAVYDEHGMLKRCLAVAEQRWVEDHCRVDKIESGPREELYEEWLEPAVQRHSEEMSRTMLDTLGTSTYKFGDVEWFRTSSTAKSSTMWFTGLHSQFSSQSLLD